MTTTDMVDEYDCKLPKLNEKGIYDYPSGDDAMATGQVEITPNPAYGTLTTCMQ